MEIKSGACEAELYDAPRRLLLPLLSQEILGCRRRRLLPLLELLLEASLLELQRRLPCRKLLLQPFLC